jgi:hypothetical protein
LRQDQLDIDQEKTREVVSKLAQCAPPDLVDAVDAPPPLKLLRATPDRLVLLLVPPRAHDLQYM